MNSKKHTYIWQMLITDVKYKTNTINSFILSVNYPNPFNPTTTIKYQPPTQSHVMLKMFDVLGREITALMNEKKPDGEYHVSWNSDNLPSGVYFYELTTGGFIQNNKMILMR